MLRHRAQSAVFNLDSPRALSSQQFKRRTLAVWMNEPRILKVNTFFEYLRGTAKSWSKWFHKFSNFTNDFTQVPGGEAVVFPWMMDDIVSVLLLLLPFPNGHVYMARDGRSRVIWKLKNSNKGPDAVVIEVTKVSQTPGVPYKCTGCFFSLPCHTIIIWF